MRTLLRSALGLLALALLGCHANSPNTPGSGPSGSAFPALSVPGLQLGTPVQQGDVTHSALGVYTIDLDLDAMTATSHLKATREAAANDDLYQLDISGFLRSDSFGIVGIIPKATTVDVYYYFRHPFDPPTNPLGTPSSTNRADLGISGMVLFPLDVPDATGNTYFTSGIANTSLITNADAYWYPGGLLTAGGIANTFPYKLLVDEEVANNGSRVGIPNQGDVRGNYGSDAWTYAEFGAGNDEWTGYGVLHQGQISVNVVKLDRAALFASGIFSLDAVIIAKYNDPRGGDTPVIRKSNRLPPETPDNRAFCYRMPHGALDVQRVQFLGETTGFIPNVISASTLSFRVADWDARATATAGPDLAIELDGSLVAAGEPGVPALSVCIPGVLGDADDFVNFPANACVDNDTAWPGGDAAQDSGRPGDALYYNYAVTKLVTTGQSAGLYTGMAQVRDPEISLNPSLMVVLDGALIPLTANVPLPITYQKFLVQQTIPNSVPQVTVEAPATTQPSGSFVTLNVTAYLDPPPTPTPIDIRFDWDGDGGFFSVGESYTTLSGPTPIPFISGNSYNNPGATDMTVTVVYEFTDNVILIPQSGSVDFTVGPNQPPVVEAGDIYLETPTLAEPATFRSKYNGIAFSDPENDPLTFTMVATPTAGAPITSSGISSLNNYQLGCMGPWNQSNSTITFTPYVNDAAHPGIAGTPIPTAPSPLLGTVTCALNSVGNVSLATYTGSGRRNGAGATGPISGIDVTWIDNNTAEAQYAIHRWNWPSGTPLSTVMSLAPGATFTRPANSTAYADASVLKDGQRYVYRVHPRCTNGGADGPASQLAVVAIQNFEGMAAGTIFPSGNLTGGWVVRSESTSFTDATIVISSIGLNNRSLRINPLNNEGLPTTARWIAIYTPPIGALDYGLIGSLNTTAAISGERPRLEVVHGRAGGYQGAITFPGGMAMFHKSTAAPAMGSATASTNAYLNQLAYGYAYNDSTVTHLSSEFGPSISGGGGDWSGGAIPLPATAFSSYVDHDPTLLALIGWADMGPSAPAHEIDEVAWLIY